MKNTFRQCRESEIQVLLSSEQENPYDFGGWSCARTDGKPELWDFDRDEVRGDVFLTAVWTPWQVTVFLDTDGGTDCPDRIVTSYGQPLSLPEPKKEGAWFMGWGYAAYPSDFRHTTVDFVDDVYLKADWLPFDPEKTIRFGKIEQDGSADNGPEPIEWLILDMTDEKYVLLSRDVLHAMTYDALNANSPDTYVNSAIRDWLNHGFYDSAFSDAEKSVILPIRIEDLGITDKVTLLSDTERQEYLLLRRSRQCVSAASKAAEDAGLRLDNTKNGVNIAGGGCVRKNRGPRPAATPPPSFPFPYQIRGGPCTASGR